MSNLLLIATPEVELAYEKGKYADCLLKTVLKNPYYNIGQQSKKCKRPVCIHHTEQDSVELAADPIFCNWVSQVTAPAFHKGLNIDGDIDAQLADEKCYTGCHKERYSGPYHICSVGKCIENINSMIYNFPVYRFYKNAIQDNIPDSYLFSNYLMYIREMAQNEYPHFSKKELDGYMKEIKRNNLVYRQISKLHKMFIDTGVFTGTLSEALIMDCPLFDLYAVCQFDLGRLYQRAIELNRPEIIKWIENVFRADYQYDKLEFIINNSSDWHYCKEKLADPAYSLPDAATIAEIFHSGIARRNYVVAELFIKTALASDSREEIYNSIHHTLNQYIAEYTIDQLYFYLRTIVYDREYLFTVRLIGRIIDILGTIIDYGDSWHIQLILNWTVVRNSRIFTMTYTRIFDIALRNNSPMLLTILYNMSSDAFYAAFGLFGTSQFSIMPNTANFLCNRIVNLLTDTEYYSMLCTALQHFNFTSALVILESFMKNSIINIDRLSLLVMDIRDPKHIELFYKKINSDWPYCTKSYVVRSFKLFRNQLVGCLSIYAGAEPEYTVNGFSESTIVRIMTDIIRLMNSYRTYEYDIYYLDESISRTHRVLVN